MAWRRWRYASCLRKQHAEALAGRVMHLDLVQFAGFFDSFWCIAFLLGLRHGFDADHLAAIDAMTRFNIDRRPGLARNAGVLFSSGHAAVVLCAALFVATVAHAWQVPLALKTWGIWLSAAILVLLAGLNIAALLQARPGRPVTGWRSLVFQRLFRSDRGWVIAGVGGMFALSFDTLGIASLLGLGASGAGGWAGALLTSTAFFAGMLVTDGINGAFIAGMMRRAGASSSGASRLMGLTVAAISMATAACGIAAAAYPEQRWMIKEMPATFSIGITMLVLASFVAGWRLRK